MVFRLPPSNIQSTDPFRKKTTSTARLRPLLRITPLLLGRWGLSSSKGAASLRAGDRSRRRRLPKAATGRRWHSTGNSGQHLLSPLAANHPKTRRPRTPAHHPPPREVVGRIREGHPNMCALTAHTSSSASPSSQQGVPGLAA